MQQPENKGVSSRLDHTSGVSVLEEREEQEGRVAGVAGRAGGQCYGAVSAEPELELHSSSGPVLMVVWLCSKGDDAVGDLRLGVGLLQGGGGWWVRKWRLGAGARPAGRV